MRTVSISDKDCRDQGRILDIVVLKMQEEGYIINHWYNSAHDKGRVCVLEIPEEESKERTYTLEEMKKAFKAGTNWGVTYSTWFIPKEEDHEKEVNKFLKTL